MPPTVKASAPIAALLMKSRRSMFSMASSEEVLVKTFPLISPFYDPFSGPLKPREDCASHHPVLVILRQKTQLLGEMGDALAVGRLGERVRQVGPPVAALRTVGVEDATQMHCHIAERMASQRTGGGARHLDAHVRILGERPRLIYGGRERVVLSHRRR